MASIKIHAGDFKESSGCEFVTCSNIFILTPKKRNVKCGWGGIEKINAKQLELIEVATEENVKKLAGTVGWGVAGGVLLGPVGLLAGLLLGGRKKEVTFVAKFKDGRKMLATTNSKTYTKILATTF